MADGSKIPLAEAPGSTPIKLAFRTGIKHVAAKNARPEKRVVIVNAVEATEAPESRRVSHVPLFEYPFLTLSFPPHSIGSVLWHAGIRPPNPRRSHRPGWLPPPPTTCPWNAPPTPSPPTASVPHCITLSLSISLHLHLLAFQLAIDPYESGDCSPDARFVRQPEGNASAISPDSPEVGDTRTRAVVSPVAAAAAAGVGPSKRPRR